MTQSEYHCDCKNDIDIVNARFTSYGSDNQQFDQIELHGETPTPIGGALPGKGKLHLGAGTENTVKVEYWDAGWVTDVCYYPISAKDDITVHGESENFEVKINGHNGDKLNVDCPG